MVLAVAFCLGTGIDPNNDKTLKPVEVRNNIPVGTSKYRRYHTCVVWFTSNFFPRRGALFLQPQGAGAS